MLTPIAVDGRLASEPGICGACGLCCDGTLFGHVEITAEEEPAVRRHGLPLFEQGALLAFAQPCAVHRGDHCAAYADRPKPCIDYRCTLLRRLDAGEVGRDEALARIAEARSLATGLRALAGPADDEGAAPRNLWTVIEAGVAARGERDDTLEWRRAHQSLLLEMAAVTTFLRRHFQPRLRQSAASPLDARPRMPYRDPPMSEHFTTFQGNVTEAIRKAIEEQVPDAKAHVSGGGGHFDIEVTSPIFAGKSMLDSQRLVYAAITHLMKGDAAPVHAVDSLKTKTP